MSATEEPMARCLGCGAEFETVRELCRGDAHAPDCEKPGECFP